MTHYETLIVENNASFDDIKRAYYKLVRQFPPERFPDKFREIRESYNVISDENQRRKYDLNLKRNIEESINLSAEAIDQIEQARDEIQRSHSGNAVKTAQALYEQYPDNSAVISLLADSYAARGWKNKASDLITSETYYNTLKTAADWDKYTFKLETLGISKIEILVKNIYGIYELSKTDKDDINMCAWVYSLCSEFDSEILKRLDLPAKFNTCDKLLDHILELSHRILIVDDKFSLASHLLKPIVSNKSPSELNDSDIRQLTVIIKIIKNIDKEHTLKKSNFGDIGDIIENIEFMLEHRSDEYDEYYEPKQKLEPIRVGVKIGRNDPCPCGSGKKYKKCCGR